MNKPQENKVLVRFSTPDPTTSIVNVTRILSDGSEEPIGLVFPNFDHEDDSVNYISVDNFGQEIFPPTKDFIEVENRFQKSVKEIADRSMAKNLEATLEEYEARKETIKSLRQHKHRTKLKLLHR
jgi:hypothetical protein